MTGPADDRFAWLIDPDGRPTDTENERARSMDDAAYFAKRAVEERAKAVSITHVIVRSVHVELAHRYAEAARRAAAGIRPFVPGSTL